MTLNTRERNLARLRCQHLGLLSAALGFPKLPQAGFDHEAPDLRSSAGAWFSNMVETSILFFWKRSLIWGFLGKGGVLNHWLCWSTWIGDGWKVLLSASSPAALFEWPWRGSGEERAAKQLFFYVCVCIQNCSLFAGINSWGVTVVPWDAHCSAALPKAPMPEQDLSIVQVWVCFSSCLLASEGNAWLCVGQPGASEIND